MLYETNYYYYLGVTDCRIGHQDVVKPLRVEVVHKFIQPVETFGSNCEIFRLNHVVNVVPLCILREEKLSFCNKEEKMEENLTSVAMYKINGCRSTEYPEIRQELDFYRTRTHHQGLRIDVQMRQFVDRIVSICFRLSK